MAEFKLGRIRFVWQGDWTTATTYYKDDVIRYGGRTYICQVGHSSAADFYTDLDFNPTKWNQLTDGQSWKGDWSTSTYYKEGDVVKYGGLLYVANNGHTSAATTSSGLEANQADWTLFAEGTDWKGNWSTSTRYKVNDLVRYGGYTYVCNLAHTSAATTTSGLENDQAKWDVFNPGIEYKGAWSGSSVRYKINDVVKVGAGLWICTTYHTSTASFATDQGNWSQFVKGFEFDNAWSSGTAYNPGDVVTYGGNQYIAKTNHTAQTPSTSTSNWDLFTEGFNFTSDWSSGTNYRIGDVTRLNGYTYLATADNVASEPPSANWTRLNAGLYWRGEWANSTAYKAGDVVRFNTSAYICVLAHTSADDDSTTVGDVTASPETDISGTYWNLLAIGQETAVLTTPGDLVYYGGAGPTRLPIGREGQILRAGNTYPEWATLGEVDHVYYVATHGTNLPAPIWGKTWDKPWASVRYACEQVENGPRNPNAKRLLELNRVFIQREVSEWIQYQVTNNIAPFTSSFDFDEYKCERDVGFIVDALIYDLGHGGNIKSRGAANSYVGGLTESETEPYGVGLGNEDSESVAALNYMLTVVEDVLEQTAPTTSYQTLNGDNSTAIVSQTFETDIEAEAGVYATCQSLVGIITDAIIAGDADDIPARVSPANLIKVATGQYREVLPIIVPEKTCILGDELRSTNIGPDDGSVDLSDARYSLGALGRLQTVVGQIVTGANVTESSGNTATQSASWPYADSVRADEVKKLVRSMIYNIDFRLNANINDSKTDPTGYNTSFLSGYGDARTLIKENREFIKAEIIAFIAANYSTVKYSKTKCKRDVGHIIDALLYDLTYSGYTQTLNAGLAYFDGPGGALQIDSSETSATVAAYNRLKTVLQQVAANTTVSKSATNTATQWTDSTNLPNGSSANSFIGTGIDIITAILTAGSTTGRPNITVTSITGSNTFITGTAHGLAAGDLVVPRTTANGVTANTRYYVLAAGLTSTDFRLSTSYAGTAIAPTNGTGLAIVFDTEDRPTVTNAVTTTTALISAYTTLSAAVGTIVTNMTAFIAATYPALTYNSTKCERDARIILDAVAYDFMFNSNVQTMRAAYSYLRASAADVYTLGQKAATRAAFSYVKDQAKSNVGGDSTAQTRIEALMTLLDDIIYTGSLEGSRCAAEERMSDYAVLQLERNRDYIVAEIDAYIESTYTTSVSAVVGATDIITCADTSWMHRNAAVRFSGVVFGGISANTTYYIQNVVNSTSFKIATSRNSNTSLNIASNASGTMTVSLYYNSALCLRDVNSYIDALKYDLKYPGNYKSLYAARYYANAVVGSLEEDMYYLRDATGIRDQTLEGLTGDLLAPNAYGTSRVSAGAYCSLDPGWGPEDYRTWIMTRSPYVQGVTTLGYGAVGQKIDGALHNGGNDSIVSNDFTQVISDGIGAWITNNGRAELVSVFTYYNHIGYLAENGGRIRATNGNNSYGDFGSVAEGVDSTETPNTAIVDNKFQFVAVVGSAFTDGDQFYQLEFDNTGIDYTEATWTLTGGGISASVEQDEFRDDGVFAVRLLDLGDDSSGQFGGDGYVSNANTAQGGTSSSITLAATDSEISTAYVGMKVIITGGAGAGQFGIITSYNSGTKLANVVKETTGASGWDHMIPGTTIETPDASTTYIVEPRITFSDPGFTNTVTTLSSSASWIDTVYGDTFNVYTGMTGTYSGTSGTNATFTVIRNGWKYSATVLAAGTGYERLETITIAGTSLGGLSPTNDLVITITAVNSTTGAILEFDIDGTGLGGRFVAIRSGSSTVAASSEDGSTWTSRTLPSASWTSITHGVFDDGSTVGKIGRFVAVATGGTVAAYSDDGITWTASTLPASTAWTSVTFGEGRFVAISSSSTTVAISQDGIVWDITGTLPGTGYVGVVYGRGIFVAIGSGTNAASSPDGITWTSRTLPASVTWSSVEWGNNRFVAIASNSNDGAYSLNGETWTAMTIGSADGSTVGGYQRVRYGQGLFMATTYQAGSEDYSFVATSENGINWTIRGVESNNTNNFAGWRALAFGTPQRTGYWVLIQYASGSVGARIRTGATTKARAFVAEEKIFAIRITEPGSGYDSLPTLTITDPNNTYEAPFTVRKGKGLLAQPSWINRGTTYTTGSAEINTGDGYADFYQSGAFVAVRRLTESPVAGSNVVFASLPDTTYKVVNVVTLLGTNDGAYTAFLQVSPTLSIADAPEHATAVSTRIRYSQVRLTGHDFLDIGTGNFTETNYPGTPTQDPIPANETVTNNGGRVFFTATDQDGNFRVGDLFAIEQSTGVATLNADAFNISGLQELNLGNVTLGGGSATITEFSTDPFFTADSDNIVPTQRAIKAYIASQIGGGGASLNVNSVTAGSIKISGNTIENITGTAIKMKATFEFRGGVIGLPIAFHYFLT